MSTYQDVVKANLAIAAWSLTEASGTTFAPYIGGSNLIGQAPLTYRAPGPVAAGFSLGLGVGSFLHLPFVATLYPPVTDECWFKLASLTVTTYQLLFRLGVTGSNGTGWYVDTSRVLHWTSPGSTPNDVNTGFVWPDTAWHLCDWVAEAPLINTFYFDGIPVARVNLNTSSSPSPNTIGYGADGVTDNVKNALNVAWPAFYTIALSPTAIYANWLAASDPDAALNLTNTGAVNASSLLQLIYAAVHKLY
jgi:hypothetical protein